MGMMDSQAHRLPPKSPLVGLQTPGRMLGFAGAWPYTKFVIRRSQPKGVPGLLSLTRSSFTT